MCRCVVCGVHLMWGGVVGGGSKVVVVVRHREHLTSVFIHTCHMRALLIRVPGHLGVRLPATPAPLPRPDVRNGQRPGNCGISAVTGPYYRTVQLSTTQHHRDIHHNCLSSSRHQHVWVLIPSRQHKLDLSCPTQQNDGACVLADSGGEGVGLPSEVCVGWVGRWGHQWWWYTLVCCR